MSARVLIVDDEPETAVEVAEYLEADLGPVDVASSGHEALARLTASSTVQLVIVDLRMPGMDGFDLIERVRRERGKAAPRFIIITGHGGAAERRKAEALQVEAFLDKPFDLERLKAEVARCLGMLCPGHESTSQPAATKTQALEARVEALEAQLQQVLAQLRALQR